MRTTIHLNTVIITIAIVTVIYIHNEMKILIITPRLLVRDLIDEVVGR